MNKLPVNLEKIKAFVLEGYDRYPAFDPSLPHMDAEIGRAFQQLCGGPGMDLHSLTCNIKHFHKRSLTGDDYLADKIIKYKVTVIVEAQLMDDVDVSSTQRP